jgi:hypothetical protein
MDNVIKMDAMARMNSEASMNLSVNLRRNLLFCRSIPARKKACRVKFLFYMIYIEVLQRDLECTWINKGFKAAGDVPKRSNETLCTGSVERDS